MEAEQGTNESAPPDQIDDVMSDASDDGRDSLDSDPDDRKYRPATADQHDDMLYDPDADAEDEEIIAKERANRDSDAILSCPACFETLCVDCQQHPQQHTQYRAMFVRGCTVSADSKVCCDGCGTIVGEFDKHDEMYYFLQVLASEP